MGPKDPTRKIGPILDRVKGILSDLYGDRLREVIVYGSYVRGEVGKESDMWGDSTVTIPNSYIFKAD